MNNLSARDVTHPANPQEALSMGTEYWKTSLRRDHFNLDETAQSHPCKIGLIAWLRAAGQAALFATFSKCSTRIHMTSPT